MEKREIEILQNLGFVKTTYDEDCNFDEYFSINPEYYYETEFAVKGDHSYDAVQILYIDNEPTKGLYYNSSLLDELYFSGYEKEIQELFNNSKKYLQDNNFITGKFLLEKRSSKVWFVINCEIQEQYKMQRNVAEFIKVIAILDYFAQQLDQKLNNN